MNLLSKNDPNYDALRNYFTTQITAIDSLTAQIVAIREALKLTVPGFSGHYDKQLRVALQPLSESEPKPSPDAPTKADQLAQAIQGMARR